MSYAEKTGKILGLDIACKILKWNAPADPINYSAFSFFLEFVEIRKYNKSAAGMNVDERYRKIQMPIGGRTKSRSSCNNGK